VVAAARKTLDETVGMRGLRAPHVRSALIPIAVLSVLDPKQIVERSGPRGETSFSCQVEAG
jgi:hypothetical protein